MDYLEWCNQNGIKTCPIKLKVWTDDQGKKQKEFKDFSFGGRATMKWFNTEWDEKKTFIEQRWNNYNNGNSHRYTHFAVDTDKIAIIDIDAVLSETHLFQVKILNLLLEYPYIQSNTKEYGKHIIIAADNIPDYVKGKKDFPIPDFGNSANGGAAIELLCKGFWEWAKLDSVIQNNNKGIKIYEELPSFAWAGQPQVPSLDHEPQQPPPPLPVAQAVAVECTPVQNIDLQAVQDNLNRIPNSTIRDVQKCSGIIKAFAASDSEDVYNLLLERCSRPDCNYSNDSWIRERWDAAKLDSRYNEYLNSWKTTWSQNRKKYNFKRFLEDPNKLFQDEFYNKYKNSFMVNLNYKIESRRVAYFNEQSKTWDEGKGKGKTWVTYLIKKEYPLWRTKLLSGYSLLPDDSESKEKYKKQVHKAIEGFLRNFSSTGSWTNGTVNHILNSIQHTPEIQRYIQYNLEDNTAHLFQFKNGAFDLKTGILIPRTKEMYITNDGILDYDYIEEEYIEELKHLKDIFMKIHGYNDVNYSSWLHWRGYCLTGCIREQFAMIKVGRKASNGKSTDSKCFRVCFPIYCDKVGNDAFNTAGAYNKCFSKFAGRPIRLYFLEEWGDKELDTAKLKEHIEDKYITCKPLFQEEINMKIQGKMEAQTNHNPNFGDDVDKGIARRFGVEYYNSEFVNKEEEEICSAEEHIYLKEDIELLFENDRYKCAFFKMFYPYAIKYYQEGLKESYRLNKNFRNLLVEEDSYTWIDDYFTATEDRYLYRQVVINIFEERLNRKVGFKEIKNIMKDKDFIYDGKKELSKGHIDNYTKSRKKGYFINIVKEDFEESDSD
jgi:hypothetical protein